MLNLYIHCTRGFKVWLLLGVSFVTVSLFMGLVNWTSIVSSIFSRHGNKMKRGGIRFSDYIGKYFLYNVNVLTTHGKLNFHSNIQFLFITLLRYQGTI